MNLAIVIKVDLYFNIAGFFAVKLLTNDLHAWLFMVFKIWFMFARKPRGKCSFSVMAVHLNRDFLCDFYFKIVIY